VLGRDLLAAALNCECEGVMVNSAASTHSIVLDMETIVALLQTKRQDRAAPDPTEGRAPPDDALTKHDKRPWWKFG
jgi:hypothetical protein